MAEPENTQHFSATAYFFARELENVLGVPVGIIESNWGGSRIETWIDSEALLPFDGYYFHSIPEERPARHKASLLYNAMIHPIEGYGMKGVIFYQGESNKDQPGEYTALFSAMINSWRKNWGIGDFPFYYVQIAPMGYKECNSAFIREAQAKTMSVTKNTGMAVILDIGECYQIHPAEKESIGKRLSYWAFTKDYGIEGIAFRSPEYKEMKNEPEGRITIYLDHVPNGISTFYKKLTGFQIAGEDKVWHEGQARIPWNTTTVEVWSEDVPRPVAVRYAWENCPEACLFSIEGLPVGSFRTDDWEE